MSFNSFNARTLTLLYRKAFTLAAESKDDRVYLDFDGVMAFLQVYVNGRLAGYDYQLKASTDGKTWTTIATKQGDHGEGPQLDHKVTVAARYLRVQRTADWIHHPAACAAVGSFSVVLPPPLADWRKRSGRPGRHETVAAGSLDPTRRSPATHRSESSGLPFPV